MDGCSTLVNLKFSSNSVSSSVTDLQKRSGMNMVNNKIVYYVIRLKFIAWILLSGMGE